MEKVKSCLAVLQQYKTEFEYTRSSIDKFFKDNVPVKKWEFSNDLVFARYDQFLKRVQLVEVSFVIQNLPVLNETLFVIDVIDNVRACFLLRRCLFLT